MGLASRHAMRKSPRRLSVSRETLRSLSDEGLAVAAGGSLVINDTTTGFIQKAPIGSGRTDCVTYSVCAYSCNSNNVIIQPVPKIYP